jgi:hypothetical protein
MKLNVSIPLMLLFVFAALADQPPSFNEFTARSANGEYTAGVTVKDKNGKERPWEWTYELQMKKADSLLWKCDYLYDGYCCGIVSDDGTTFIRVSEWYSENEPVVSIYQNGQLKKQINGAEFSLDSSKLPKSVTHVLWLKDRRPYKFVSPVEMPPGLEINTADGQMFNVNLQTLELKLMP